MGFCRNVFRAQRGGCFQSVCKAAVSRIFAKYLGKEMWWSPFKVKLCKNSENGYGLRVSVNFLQGYWKVWIIMGGKLWKTEVAYFWSNCLWDLNHN